MELKKKTIVFGSGWKGHNVLWWYLYIPKIQNRVWKLNEFNECDPESYAYYHIYESCLTLINS